MTTMRNRKTIIVAFVLVACMLIGVGYAALTNELVATANLKADPSAASDQFDSDIRFTDKSITQDDTNKATCVIASDGNSATITADGFTHAGQTVVVLLTITNASVEFDAELTPTVNLDAAHPDVFSAEAKWAGESDLAVKEVLKNGGTAQVEVTLTLEETPTEEHTATFTVTFGVLAK